MAVKRSKSRGKRGGKSSAKAVAKTRKQIAATRKLSKSSRTTRKLPKFKKSKKKAAKKLPRPTFRRQVIQGQGGQLVKIMEPIGYQDFQTKFRRLIKDEKYKALRKEFPSLTYSIFGHPGNHKAPSLAALLAFMETAYDAQLSNRKTRSKFAANIVIYGVKRSYRVSPPLANAHGRKRRKARRGL